MAYKTFTIPAFHGDWAERELNQFLQSHRILAVDRRWVDQGSRSFWAVCVDYLDGSVESSAGAGGPASKKRIDYKDQLTPEDFELYLGLRGLRKDIAEREAVAVFNVLTNEQMAQVARGKPRTLEDLRKVAGLGEARVDKYGARILEFIKENCPVPDEESKEPPATDS